MRLERVAAAALIVGPVSVWAAAGPRDTGELPPVFAANTVLALELQAPLQDLFGRARQDEKAGVPGRLVYPDGNRTVAIDRVQVSVRGNTSRNDRECSFPKLKIDLGNQAGSGTIFQGMRELKIGTHCGERPETELTPRYGRLANERSAHREAFVYRLLNLMEVPTLLARPARITYRDTGVAPTPSTTIERDAIIIEGTSAAIRRLGSAAALDPRAFSDADSIFDRGDTATLAFAEAMIGNFDWCLRFFDGDTYRCDDRRGLWNISVAPLPDGRSVPLIYDFDIAGMVTGVHPWFSTVYSSSYAGNRSAAAVEVLSQVQRTRSLFPRDLLDRTRARFLSRRSDAMIALAAASLDDRGRTIITDYLRSFFRAIADDAFYAPVVVSQNFRAYVDAGGRQLACPERPRVPVGTAVSEPLDTKGSLIEVRVLDTHWTWAPPVRCEAMRGPVWIEQSAVATDYPR